METPFIYGRLARSDNFTDREKDIIDILPQKRIVLQNPVFELWLR